MTENQEGGPLTETVFYVLLALQEPLHGYAVMQRVAEMSGGRVNLGAGTLYGALNALVDKGWIVPLPGEAGDRRKRYESTPAGTAVLQAEIRRLEELLANGRRILGGDS